MMKWVKISKIEYLEKRRKKLLNSAPNTTFSRSYIIFLVEITCNRLQEYHESSEISFTEVGE